MKNKNKLIKIRIFPSVWSKIIFGLIAIPIFLLVSFLFLVNAIIIGTIIFSLFVIGSIILLIWRIRLR